MSVKLNSKETLNALQALPAAGTLAVQIPVVGESTQSVLISVVASYVTAAATSGIQAGFQVSSNGSTFTAAAESNVVAAGAANSTNVAQQKIALEGPLKRNTTGSITAVEVNLTNLDATNAATVAVIVQESDYL